MNTLTFFFIFIPLLAFILLAINLIFAPHSPYLEKNSPFECGFHSFLGQNRTQFSISFFIFALLFLLFDLEILLVYPYVVSASINDIYGLLIMLVFFLILTLGFVFELGKNALKIDSKQFINNNLKLETSDYNYNLLLVFTTISLEEINIEELKNIDLTIKFLDYIIILGLIITTIISIILMASSNEDAKPDKDTKKEIPTMEISPNYIKMLNRMSKRQACKHEWEVHYKRIECGYTTIEDDLGCNAVNDINWKCKLCDEIRCGTHTNSNHTKPNKGLGSHRD